VLQKSFHVVYISRGININLIIMVGQRRQGYNSLENEQHFRLQGVDNMQDNEEISERVWYKEYEDAIFRLAMHMAAEIEGKIYMEKMEVLKNDPQYIPTPENIKKFCTLLDRKLKKRSAYTGRG
jgi:hypothetical protein